MNEKIEGEEEGEEAEEEKEEEDDPAELICDLLRIQDADLRYVTCKLNPT